MWSFGQRKAQQRRFWQALDHWRGVVLASGLGSRAEEGVGEWQRLLKPFGLVHCYTDAAGVYERHLTATAHTVGELYTQQIARKHLTLRARISRVAGKTRCFSHSASMPDTVLGLFVNRYGSGAPV
jgi:insertion element IS1 protein InsB